MLRAAIKSAYERSANALYGALRGVINPLSKRGDLLPYLYVIVIVAMAGGFVDALAYPVPNQGILVFQGGGAQTIPEALLDSFIILLGGAGIYLTYISGRQTTKTRAVNMYLALALLLIFVSALAGVQMLILKGY
jgi:hypothetical protein